MWNTHGNVILRNKTYTKNVIMADALGLVTTNTF